MNRTIRPIAACALAAAVLAVPAAASAVQPTKGACPTHTWVLNGPDDWLAATEAGIIAEGSTMAEQMALLGFDDLDEFKAWIVDGVFGAAAGLDANGDGLICRSTNTPSGYPEFFFQVHDNKYNAKFA